MALKKEAPWVRRHSRIARAPGRSRLRGAGQAKPLRLACQIQGDTAVALPKPLDAYPDDVAGGQEHVEHRRLVVFETCRQNLRLQNGRGHGGALQLLDRVEQCLGAAAPAGDPVPGNQKSGERVRLDRLDFTAEPGKRSPAQHAQHIGVDPLAAVPSRAELALYEPARAFEPRRMDSTAGVASP